MAEYQSFITEVGAQALAAVGLENVDLNLSEIAISDNGDAITGTETELVSEVHRQAISALYIDENDPTKLIAETDLSAEVGGFTIRKAAVFDSLGRMIAICRLSDTVKPVLSDGITQVTIRVVIKINPALSDKVELLIDPQIVKASRQYVHTLIEPFEEHIEDYRNPHQVTAAQIGINIETTEINQILNSLKGGKLSENGWARFPNGFTIQWGEGTVSATNTNKGKFWWAFPVPFSVPCFGISATDFAADENYHHDISCTQLNIANIQGYAHLKDGSVMTAGLTNFFILAVGYISDEDFADMGE